MVTAAPNPGENKHILTIAAIKTGLNNKEFSCVGQPIFVFPSKNGDGYKTKSIELYVRWKNHDTEEVMTLAEKDAILDEDITNFVLDNIHNAYRNNKKEVETLDENRVFTFNINMTHHFLSNINVTKFIKEHKNIIPFLAIEILERLPDDTDILDIYSEKNDRFFANLMYLKSQGIQIIQDDVNSPNGMNMLKMFLLHGKEYETKWLDCVKLSRSFLPHLLMGEETKEGKEAFDYLCNVKMAGIPIVLEGTDNLLKIPGLPEDQRGKLVSPEVVLFAKLLGIDHGQGFGLQTPGPINDMLQKYGDPDYAKHNKPTISDINGYMEIMQHLLMLDTGMTTGGEYKNLNGISLINDPYKLAVLTETIDGGADISATLRKSVSQILGLFKSYNGIRRI